LRDLLPYRERKLIYEHASVLPPKLPRESETKAELIPALVFNDVPLANITINGIFTMVRNAKKYINALTFIRKRVDPNPISFAIGEISLS